MHLVSLHGLRRCIHIYMCMHIIIDWQATTGILVVRLLNELLGLYQFRKDYQIAT